MWGHYAKSHTGFVVEYDFRNYNSPCTNCKQSCYYTHYDLLFPVIYSNQRFNAKDFVASFFSQSIFGKAPYEIFIPRDDDLSNIKILLHKSLDWEYEKEWRIISRCNIKPVITQKPTRIYLGVEMSLENKRKLKTFADNNGIECHEMFIKHDSKEYEISY